MRATNIHSGNMSFTQADIIRALSKVEDPDLKRDLVTLNMIRDVKVYSDNVSFTVVLTTPACPLREASSGSGTATRRVGSEQAA